MIARTTTPHRRITLRLAAAGLLTALAVSGCQVGTVDDPEVVAPGDDETTADEPVADDTDTDDTTADEPVADDTDTDDTTADDTTAGADDTGDQPDTGSGEVAAPGSEFQVGDTVTTHVQAGEEGEEFYGYATVGTTVVSVEEGDPALFEEAENAEDFAGYTPWYLVAEHEWLTYEGNPNSNMIPNLVGFNESGGEVSKIINQTWSAGIPGCDLDLPEKAVGNTATNCHVFAVPDGESIGSVGWRGDDWADGGGSPMDNPYYDDPVLWVVP